jgi:hypothetical protein
VGEGVLEGILTLWKEHRLVQELGGLEVRQAAMERRFGKVGDGLQQRPWHLGADDGGGLEEALVLGGQAIDTCGQHRLHRGGHLQAVEGFDDMIGTRCSDQHAGLDQRADALLEKEGIAFGALDQLWREGREAGVVTEKGLQQCVGARG